MKIVTLCSLNRESNDLNGIFLVNSRLFNSVHGSRIV